MIVIRTVLVVAFMLLGDVCAEFVRDDAKEVVNDSKTCLMWQDDSASKSVKKSWSDAIAYCQDLSFAGFTDWRLPNITELLSITDLKKYDPSIQETFKNSDSGFYWSSTSTTSASGTSDAWIVDFNNGKDDFHYKVNNIYVRCVRAGH